MDIRSAMSKGAGWILCLPIKGYRIFLSPLLPPSCRYQPTCSAYALEAIEIHGPLRGGWLALKRISRCHPVTWLGGGSGFDPVPQCGCGQQASQKAQEEDGLGNKDTTAHG